MMNQTLIICIALSALLSLFLVVRLWKGNEYLPIKIGLTLITFIPFIGPVFYAFYIGFSETEPQSKLLQNNLPRGDYTQGWITMLPLLKSIVKGKKEEVEKYDKEDEKS